MTTKTGITEEIIEDIKQQLEGTDGLERQLELEERMRVWGVDRYWSSVTKAKARGNETATLPVKRMMSPSIEAVKAGIECFLIEAGMKKAGVKHTAAPYLAKIEPEVAAYMTVRIVMDQLVASSKFTGTARKLGAMIEEELAFRRFKEEDKEAYSFLVARCKDLNAGSYSRNRNTMIHNMKSREIEYEVWTEASRVLLGSKLIEIMAQWTGLVSVELETKTSRKVVYNIVATERTKAWIEEEHAACEMMTPMYLPTLIPPKPWTGPHSGGYWGAFYSKINFVKSWSSQYLEELESHDMPKVYDAVNAMQHTAWAINTAVLEVAKMLWDRGSTHGGIPSADDWDLPPKPVFLEEDKPKEEWTEEQTLEFKDWKRAATDIYKLNSSLKSQRLRFITIMSTAENFADEEAIYFPHNLDFRGRAYAMPTSLNPQGSDFAKGVLEFSRGVAIDDEEAANWLRIHGTGCFGYDKVSMTDRVKWVEDNQEEILYCADNPLDARLWSEADKPYQFLAFCFDYAGFVREGYGYLSSLPVQMDGSCNGLQNFSAMLKDSIGGAAVNLIPSDTPSDIYQRVADKVQDQVIKDCESEDEFTRDIALGWLDVGINRKVCKRPVMTLAYGAKKFGFRTQVYDDTVAPLRYTKGSAETFPWTGSGWAASSYMGGVIWDCVGKVVIAASEAMEWLQGASNIASKEGLPLRWETEDGLPVVQSYPKVFKKNVKLTFGGTQLRLKIAEDQKGTVDIRRQANGIAPNWVHSMDATHMRGTVRESWAKGIRSFSLIHDSYGTHAGNAWALAETLREEFVRIYTENNVLEKFREELLEQLSEGTELKPIPDMGDLDLEAVKESEYFFA